MASEEIKFTIDQLRKDKIIYAIEACATVLVCILVFFFSNQYFPLPLKDYINVLVVIIAVGYTIFMGIGNFIRLNKIHKLEKQLEK